MRLKPRASRAGFSLIEMAITVAVIGVLSVLGVAIMQDAVPGWRTRRAALEFAEHVNGARMRAVAESVQVRIILDAWDTDIDAYGGLDSVGAYRVQKGDASTGSSSWDTLPADMDGSDSLTWEGTIDFSEGSEHSLTGVSLDNTFDGTIDGVGGESNTLVFSPRGWMQNPATDFACDIDDDGAADGYICFDFVNKKARAHGRTDMWRVMVSRGGIARVQSPEGTPVGGAGGTDATSSVGGSPVGYEGASSGSEAI